MEKSMPSYIDKVWTRFYGANVAPKRVEALTSQKISFALFVDDFGVKYTDKDDAQHLLTCLEKLYKCTTDWEGKLYLGMTLN